MRIHSTGRKRRFGAAGLINIFATNLVLQLLLSSHWVTISLATFISQLFNGFLGYVLYGKWVFRRETLYSWQPPLSYSALMALLWFLNTAGIRSLSSTGLGISRNLAALIMIAPLAALSYSLQRYLIFTPQD